MKRGTDQSSSDLDFRAKSCSLLYFRTMLVVDKLLRKTKMTSHHYTDQGPNVGTIRKLSLRSNAAPHKAGATLQHRERGTLQVMPHLPYSPDLFSIVREKRYKSCHTLQPWLIQHLEGERLQVLPHSPYMCSPDLFSILREKSYTSPATPSVHVQLWLIQHLKGDRLQVLPHLPYVYSPDMTYSAS